MHALAANDGAALSSRLDTEIGYGLGGPAGRGTVTPYAALGAGRRRRGAAPGLTDRQVSRSPSFRAAVSSWQRHVSQTVPAADR